jgi:hypothetical protein
LVLSSFSVIVAATVPTIAVVETLLTIIAVLAVTTRDLAIMHALAAAAEIDTRTIGADRDSLG